MGDFRLNPVSQSGLVHKWVLGLLALLVISTSSIAQDLVPIAPVDSTTARQTQPADSLKAKPDARRGNVEGPVKYWADDISFSIPEQTTYLRGKVRIEYQNTTLTAGSVDIDWKHNRMLAKGVADSTDSLGNAVFTDFPVLTEKGEDPIRGVQLEYDFKNNRGKVLEGRTEMSPGYYKGEDIRKIGQETLLIEDGYFTTCDNEEHPHFYFRSKQMRVRLKKVAVAKPVTLYIADVPIIGVPFAIFALQRGRRSGIILPTYAETSAGGRALERFGYYWAPSQYWDFTYLNSYYERRGFLFSGELNYKRRYDMTGKINGTYQPKDLSTGARTKAWQVAFNHNQKIGQTLTINGNGRFVSSKSFLQNYSDFEQRTNQTLTTNVSVRKILPGSRSVSLNFRRTENLQTEQLDYTFPDLSYSQPSKYLFNSSGSQKSWYHNIRYTYSSNLRNSVSRTAIRDTLDNRTGFNRTNRSGWQHLIRPSFSTKVLKYFNFAPSIGFEELWVPDYLKYTYDDSTKTTKIDTVSGFQARHLMTGIGANVSTTMYGLFEIPFSPMKVVRHKMDPSIGFSYAPDYTDEAFGYFQEVRDGNGNLVAKRDKFANNAFGGTPGGGEQRNLNISVNNFFQGKIIRDGEEKKIDLFRVNFGTSYNFARDSLKWSNITTSFQSKPLKNLNITANANHSFYKEDFDGLGRRNDFVWADGFSLPHLLDWRTSVTYQLNITPPQKGDKSADADADADADSLAAINTPDIYGNQRLPGDPRYQDFEPLDIPWRIGMNFSFSYAENDRSITRRFDTSMNGQLQITKGWQIRYSNRINIKEREIITQNFNISRDLHCWQLDFTWSPGKNFSYYRLEIRVKESMLRDLKLTKTAGGRPVF